MRYNIMKAIYPVAGLLMLAACSQDETIDNNTLPEGKYPLQIASVTMNVESSQQPWNADAPQTRVSENSDRMSSAWQNGDRIKVQIGEGTPGTYTYQEGSLTVANGDAPAYWASKTDGQTIKAWYTSSANNETVDLSSQTNSLAYVLQAQATADFNTEASLSFNHRLAKVRVVLTGDKAGDVTDVKIKSYTSCTHTQGTISTDGAAEGWITMQYVADEGYWEANVVPDYAITKFQVNGTTEGTLTTSVTPEAGKVHEIKITVKQKVTEIQPGSDGNYTVNGGDNVIIKGNGSQTTGQIIINGTATVTIQNVNIKTSGKSAIKITNGTATIKLEGNNKLESSNSPGVCAAGIELSSTNSHVIIEGNENASLTVTADYGNPAIGSGNGGKGGNIIIRNANITAEAINNLSSGCGAAIGSGSSWVSEGEARIGVISIINSDITASVGNNQNSAAAVIGTGDTTYSNEKNSCGGINITLKAGQTKSQFLANLTGSYSVQVGAGSNSRGGTNTCGSINWYNSDGTEIK